MNNSVAGKIVWRHNHVEADVTPTLSFGFDEAERQSNVVRITYTALYIQRPAYIISTYGCECLFNPKQWVESVHTKMSYEIYQMREKKNKEENNEKERGKRSKDKVSKRYIYI